MFEKLQEMKRKRVKRIIGYVMVLSLLSTGILVGATLRPDITFYDYMKPLIFVGVVVWGSIGSCLLLE